jgi:hypothetical protein
MILIPDGAGLFLETLITSNSSNCLNYHLINELFLEIDNPRKSIHRLIVRFSPIKFVQVGWKLKIAVEFGFCFHFFFGRFVSK